MQFCDTCSFIHSARDDARSGAIHRTRKIIHAIDGVADASRRSPAGLDWERPRPAPRNCGVRTPMLRRLERCERAASDGSGLLACVVINESISALSVVLCFTHSGRDGRSGSSTARRYRKTICDARSHIGKDASRRIFRWTRDDVPRPRPEQFTSKCIGRRAHWLKSYVQFEYESGGGSSPSF